MCLILYAKGLGVPCNGSVLLNEELKENLLAIRSAFELSKKILYAKGLGVPCNGSVLLYEELKENLLANRSAFKLSKKAP
ncbi:hypothetical protein ACET3Z_017084 [Daucus carota]